MENGKWKMDVVPRDKFASSPSIYHFPFHIFHSRPLARRAFTLVQMLVVIAILAALMGLLLPAIVRSYATALRTRTEADLHLIETGLEAYKQDFGDYPRFVPPQFDSSGTIIAPNWLDRSNTRGAWLLCRALIGPGPMGAVQDVDASAADNGADGADGPGFRARRSMMTGPAGTPVVTGKVYGPYIQPDKFSILSTLSTGNLEGAVILDRWNHPILYYPASTSQPQLKAPKGYVAYVDPTTASATAPVTPLYNAFDNEGIFQSAGDSTTSATQRLQVVMGADSTSSPSNGAIMTGRTTTYTGPYLLWTAGADGIFGLDSKNKTDDVTNFEFPPGMQR